MDLTSDPFSVDFLDFGPESFLTPNSSSFINDQDKHISEDSIAPEIIPPGQLDTGTRSHESNEPSIHLDPSPEPSRSLFIDPSLPTISASSSFDSNVMPTVNPLSPRGIIGHALLAPGSCEGQMGGLGLSFGTDDPHLHHPGVLISNQNIYNPLLDISCPPSPAKTTDIWCL